MDCGEDSNSIGSVLLVGRLQQPQNFEDTATAEQILCREVPLLVLVAYRHEPPQRGQVGGGGKKRSQRLSIEHVLSVIANSILRDIFVGIRILSCYIVFRYILDEAVDLRLFYRRFIFVCRSPLACLFRLASRVHPRVFTYVYPRGRRYI